MPHGTFAWNELLTDDVDKAKAFYGEVLGWSFETFDTGGGAYWVATSNGEAVGGIGPAGAPGEASRWFSTLEVDDVDARVALAVEHGATVLQPAEDVPNVGRFAVIEDPTGAAIGFMTGAQSPPT